MTLALVSRGTKRRDGLSWSRRRQMLPSLVTLLGVVSLLLFIGFGFVPIQLGGDASYVVTDGTSMLPTFTAEGLVVTRRQAAYHVGEVVAYHNKDLNAVVMHRIVGRDRSRYVFKGDNNDYPDHYHATRADLVGKEWIYLPGAGHYLLWLRNPMTFAIIIGLMALVSFRPDSRSRRRRRHHAR